MTRPPLGRVLFALLVLVTIGGAALHVAQWLREPPLWVDEEMIALNVRDRPFSRLPGQLWLGQSAPLGWLAVQRAVFLTLGTTELVTRLVPLLFGIATLVAAAWIGLRWTGALAGSVLVVMLATGEWMSHFTFELKHYSADAFWAFLLPALAAWALDPRDNTRSPRRWLTWWIVAAVGQLFANGAMLATPACAVVMFIIILGRAGTGQAIAFAALGGVWLATFAAHYILSLQYTANSRFLWSIWGGEVRPASAGLVETAVWLGGRLEPLALRPGGATSAALFWSAALAGLLLTRHRVLGILFLTVPLSAVLLGVLRVVPLHDRFALWMVPSLYVGITLLLDSGLHHLSTATRAKRWMLAAPALAAVVLAALPAGDVIAQGRRHLDIGVRPDNNHGVDDRSAVRWLLTEARPGDAIVTTRLGWPAIWWYGKIPMLPRPPGGKLPGGIPMIEMFHEAQHPQCTAALTALAAQHKRLIVYIGFPDHLLEFRDVVVSELRKVGRIVETRDFAALSKVLVVHPGNPELQGVTPPAGDEEPGCVGVGLARRW